MSAHPAPLIITVTRDGYVTQLCSTTMFDTSGLFVLDPIFDGFNYLLTQGDEFYISGWKYAESTPYPFETIQSLLFINGRKGNPNLLRENMSPIQAYTGDVVIIEHQLYYDYPNESYHHLWRVKSDRNPDWYRFDSYWDTIQWSETLTKSVMFFKLIYLPRYPFAVEYNVTDPNYINDNRLTCFHNVEMNELTIGIDQYTPTYQPFITISPVSSFGLSDKETIAASINGVVNSYTDIINNKISNLNKIYQR